MQRVDAQKATTTKLRICLNNFVRELNKMKTLLFMLGALIAPSVIAEETVNLVCVKPVDEAFLEFTSFHQEQ